MKSSKHFSAFFHSDKFLAVDKGKKTSSTNQISQVIQNKMRDRELLYVTKAQFHHRNKMFVPYSHARVHFIYMVLNFMFHLSFHMSLHNKKADIDFSDPLSFLLNFWHAIVLSHTAIYNLLYILLTHVRCLWFYFYDMKWIYVTLIL